MSNVLSSERLVLRPVKAADISRFLPLINEFEVAKNLCRVPHPYTEDDACAFVVAAARGLRTREGCAFAITRNTDGTFIGICGVHRANGFELGYWLGKPFWGQGYATEAAVCVVNFAFDDLGAETLVAGWFHDNPASGRVLEKLGFKLKGQELRPSLARGVDVLTYLVALDRMTCKTRKNAP